MQTAERKNKYKIFCNTRILFVSLFLILLSAQSFTQDKGLVWGINLHNEVWRWDGSNWQQVYGSLKIITVGSEDNVWGIAPNNDIYKWSGNSWSLIQGKLKTISAGADGETWGVSPQNDIYRYTGNGWQKIEGKLKEVAVGGRNIVFGIDPNNKIWKWTGNGWQKFDGSLSNISVAADGSVWGIDSNGAIWRYKGNGWEKIKGSLHQISSGGADLAWGVTKDGVIYKYKNGSWYKMPGNLDYVSVGSPALTYTDNMGGKSTQPSFGGSNSNSLLSTVSNLYDDVSNTKYKSLFLSSAEVSSAKTKLNNIQTKASRSGCYDLADLIDDVKTTLNAKSVRRSTLLTKLNILYDYAEDCE